MISLTANKIFSKELKYELKKINKKMNFLNEKIRSHCQSYNVDFNWHSSESDIKTVHIQILLKS